MMHSQRLNPGLQNADKLNLAVQQGFWSAVIKGGAEPDPNEQLTLKPHTLHTLDLTAPQACGWPETISIAGELLFPG